MHDGRFIHVDPWRQASFWSQITASIFWDIWPQVVLYTGIAAIVVGVNNVDRITTAHINIPSTMLTVLGTVIGFVVSYRTHSAYDRFLEGAHLWGRLTSTSRSMARLIWFHVPFHLAPPPEGTALTDIPDHERAQAMIEKKTVINLVSAHVIALKHYLRGEPTPYYEDLWATTCFLPRYAMPTSVEIDRPDLGNAHPHHALARSNSQPPPSTHDDRHASHAFSRAFAKNTNDAERANSASVEMQEPHRSWSGSTAASEHLQPIHIHGLHLRHRTSLPSPPLMHGPRFPPQPLLPARNPAPFDIIEDVAPFLEPFRKAYHWIKEKTENAATKQRRLRKQRKRVQSPLAIELLMRLNRHRLHDDNMPLELQLYFSSYLCLLQRRRILDVPTTSHLMEAIGELQSILTGLEKIVTVPIPFAYMIHLKQVTWLYLGLLPFQLERYLHWVTIPAVFVASFMFLGFLGVASQIEGPFGYDANDLDLDDICSTLDRELKEMTAHPPAGPDDFIFVHSNEPFYPADKRTALQMAKQNIAASEVEAALLRGHERAYDSLLATIAHGFADDLGWREIKGVHRSAGGKVPMRDSHFESPFSPQHV